MSNSPLNVPLPAYVLEWDESALLSQRARDLLAEDADLSESEAQEQASLDPDFLESEFSYFLENFTEMLNRVSPDGSFHVKGRNMGWRHLSGSLECQATGAAEFIRKAFPGTSEWTCKGLYDPALKQIKFTLWHHDAPTGEFYEVMTTL